MTITPTALTRAAGLCAVAAGLIFIGVQINHPPMDVSSVTSTEWEVRFTAKLVMCGLALAGITGMYLLQVRQVGVFGLVGYVLLSAFYVLEAGIEILGGYVLPSLADVSPSYVNDVLAAATGGSAAGDIGLLQTVFAVAGVCYIGGGLVFGIALFRARVLARWAAALLAVSTVSTVALTLLPVLVLALRWASFLPSVIDWDESLYLLQAREWLRGNWPLSGVWDMHPVGAPALIAAAFLLPAHGRISGVFGSQRILNGEPRQPHFGFDIAAPTGTPIVAIAAGEVVLAAEFFFFGRLTVIDHGHGVNSLYAHMSAQDVAEGERVAAGQRIGAIGATGRVTGPHLHFGLSWYSTWLDAQPVLPPVTG